MIAIIISRCSEDNYDYELFSDHVEEGGRAREGSHGEVQASSACIAMHLQPGPEGTTLETGDREGLVVICDMALPKLWSIYS